MRFRFINQLQLKVDSRRSQLQVDYKARNNRVYYDICDKEGKIIKTGQFSKSRMTLDLSGLRHEQYVLLLMDGKHIIRKIFNWRSRQTA